MKRVKKEVNKKEVNKKEVNKKEVNKKIIEKVVKKAVKIKDEVSNNLIELKKLSEDIKKHTFAYQNCISNVCLDERVAVMKDTNKNAPKINFNILFEKDIKKKNEFFKKHVEYPLNFNLYKCNYDKCNAEIKNMIHCILKASLLMKKLKKANVIVYDDDFYKEFNDLLNKQKVSDEELKELMNKFLQITLNMTKFE